MTRTIDSLVLELEQRVNTLEDESNGRDIRGDRKMGVYGIRDIRKLQVKRQSEYKVRAKTWLLGDNSWNFRDQPSEAKYNDLQTNVDLSEQLFHSPIFLELCNRSSGRSYRVPVFDGTIYDVFSTIHDFYRLYEATPVADEEDMNDLDIEEGLYTMNDGIWFEGLTSISPEVWSVEFGS